MKFCYKITPDTLLSEIDLQLQGYKKGNTTKSKTQHYFFLICIIYFPNFNDFLTINSYVNSLNEVKDM